MAYEECVLQSRIHGVHIHNRTNLSELEPSTLCIRVIGIEGTEVKVERSAYYWTCSEGRRLDPLCYFYFINRKDTFNRVINMIKEAAMRHYFSDMLLADPMFDPVEMEKINWFSYWTTSNNLEKLHALSWDDMCLRHLR